MRQVICLSCVFVAASIVASGQVDVEPQSEVVSCAVTVPNGVTAAVDETPSSLNFGSKQISVLLWPDSTVVFRPGGSGFLTRSDALGMKFPWQRGVSGQLTIDGRRLDGAASPLRAEVPHGYGDRGFQATYIIFPTPGCWEVTGRVGDASLTFVTRVVKVGAGPAWRRDVP